MKVHAKAILVLYGLHLYQYPNIGGLIKKITRKMKGKIWIKNGLVRLALGCCIFFNNIPYPYGLFNTDVWFIYK